MSGDVIRWWSMRSYNMARGGENAADRSTKAMSWEIVNVVVFTIGGDARDVVAVCIVSGLMGSVCSCDIRSGGNENMTISFISIIIISVAYISISIVIVMMVCCGDGRVSAGMTSSGHSQMGWW